MLFSGDPISGECNCDTFSEVHYEDPWAAAEGLRDSCAPDFPGRMWAITGNERALEIRKQSRMRAIGL